MSVLSASIVLSVTNAWEFSFKNTFVFDSKFILYSTQPREVSDSFFSTRGVLFALGPSYFPYLISSKYSSRPYLAFGIGICIQG
jgi:hypothetical protein